MQVENIPITAITPYNNNARNNMDAITKVKESIEKFGFNVPLVVDKNNVIVTGHARYKAVKELGIMEIPTIIADTLSADKIRQFRIIDNSTQQLSKWDNDKLESEILDIDSWDEMMSSFDDTLNSVLEEFNTLEDTGEILDDQEAISEHRTKETISTTTEKYILCPYCGEENSVSSLIASTEE